MGNIYPTVDESTFGSFYDSTGFYQWMFVVLVKSDGFWSLDRFPLKNDIGRSWGGVTIYIYIILVYQAYTALIQGFYITYISPSSPVSRIRLLAGVCWYLWMTWLQPSNRSIWQFRVFEGFVHLHSPLGKRTSQWFYVYFTDQGVAYSSKNQLADQSLVITAVSTPSIWQGQEGSSVGTALSGLFGRQNQYCVVVVAYVFFGMEDGSFIGWYC